MVTLKEALINDDEFYIPSDLEDAAGKQYFYANNRDDVKYIAGVKPNAKFFKKYFDEFRNFTDGFVCEG